LPNRVQRAYNEDFADDFATDGKQLHVTFFWPQAWVFPETFFLIYAVFVFSFFHLFSFL